MVWHLELHKCESQSLKLAVQIPHFLSKACGQVYRFLGPDMDFSVFAQSGALFMLSRILCVKIIVVRENQFVEI